MEAASKPRLRLPVSLGFVSVTGSIGVNLLYRVDNFDCFGYPYGRDNTMGDNQQVSETGLEAQQGGELQRQKENLFKPLVPDAYRTLRRTMLNAKDAKLAKEAAESVLDRAGETKKQEERVMPQVNITNSQIQLLVQASKEVDNE